MEALRSVKVKTLKEQWFYRLYRRELKCNTKRLWHSQMDSIRLRGINKTNVKMPRQGTEMSNCKAGNSFTTHTCISLRLYVFCCLIILIHHRINLKNETENKSNQKLLKLSQKTFLFCLCVFDTNIEMSSNQVESLFAKNNILFAVVFNENSQKDRKQEKKVSKNSNNNSNSKDNNKSRKEHQKCAQPNAVQCVHLASWRLVSARSEK